MSTPPAPALEPAGPENGFQDLMRDQVRDVLFVSSLYDSFILAEDELGDVVRAKFQDLNQLQVPTLHQVATGGEALALLRAGRHFDMVLTALNAGDMDALALASAVGELAPGLPVVLLAYDYGALKDVLSRGDQSAIHRSFLWQGDARILLAIVKGVEDERNVAHDARAGVPILLVVEDNIRNYSSFLPVIYDEVERHSQQVTSEGLNLAERILRLRARPKILLATSFEQAQAWFEAYPDDVLGVISDVEFPRGGQRSPEAGLELARLIRQARPDVTIALHSSHAENERVAASIGAVFLPKRSPHLLQRLREQLKDAFAFGDFVFRTQDGREIDRAANIDDLVRLIGEVPGECLAFHGVRNDFSRWLRVRAEFHLARGLRPRRISDFSDLEQLRRELVHSIEMSRRERARGTVADFQPRAFSAHGGIARIGGGSLGGKARGLAFAARMLDRFRIGERFPRVRVFVPPAVVLGTEVFDGFLDANRLREAALDLDDDAARAGLFRQAPLPEAVCRELERFLDTVHAPLAVRSSSLLEDSPYEPFAGIFETRMLPNAAADPAVRLAQLETAIKDVYASAFSGGARRLLEATPYRMEEARMAVVLQPVVGARHGTRFYPSFAGVARSHNFYPLAPATADDGVAALALGLGKTVVEDGPCVRFSPAFPRHLPELTDPLEALRNTQREFWAIDLSRPDDDRLDAVISLGLDVAEADGTLGPVASTYSRENNALYDGIGRDGARLVTFAPVLKLGVFPVAGILRELLQLGMRTTNSPVEIEFAVNLEPPAGEPAQFALLQLRPLAALRELEAVDTDRFDPDELVCRSSMVLGNGRIEDVCDVVVIDAASFNPYLNPQTARHIARFNAQLAGERRPYLLVGVGRWGSSHPQMGIPVNWDDIAGARAIVEAGRADLHVAPSQGSHFFHNLSASGIGYFVVNPQRDEGTLDWEWLAEQPEQASLGVVRHLRFDRPLTIVMNGRKREGVIRKPA
jgi:CheY-like chemotaxis protein